MALVVEYRTTNLIVIFRPKTLGLQYMLLLLRFYVFLKIQKRDFLRFLLCFTHFLELCWGIIWAQIELQSQTILCFNFSMIVFTQPNFCSVYLGFTITMVKTIVFVSIIFLSLQTKSIGHT